MHSTFSRLRHSSRILAPFISVPDIFENLPNSRKATVRGFVPPASGLGFVRLRNRAVQAGPVTPTPIIRTSPTTTGIRPVESPMALVRLAWLGSVDATGISRQAEYRKRGVNASRFVDKLF